MNTYVGPTVTTKEEKTNKAAVPNAVEIKFETLSAATFPYSFDGVPNL